MFLFAHALAPDLFSLRDQDIFCVHFFSTIPTPQLVPTITAQPTPAPTNTPAPPSVIRISKSPDLILASNKPQRKTTLPKHIVYSLPSQDEVLLSSEIPFFDKLVMDIYYPPGYHFEKKLPVVILAHGFNDIPDDLDKDQEAHMDWAKMIAESGMIVASAQAGSEPVTIGGYALDFLAINADLLGVDPSRIGFWATSGQGSSALNAFYSSKYRDNFKAAVFMYATTGTPSSWPKNISVLAVIAKMDGKSRGSMNLLVSDAEKNQIPIGVITLNEGVHAFDSEQDTQDSKDTIQKVLDFLSKVLLKTK
jgi:hypothetical protein